MDIVSVKSQLLNEEYIEINHSSGLKIFVMPKKDYKAAYAIFGTKYGSVDTCFKTEGDEEFTKVPEGIAHLLEHKLFESEELDAFSRFEKTGASANAFTSFDKTCYLFQCTENLESSLEILLDFVKSPFFTEETVKKEQGIIGQEIRMYEDNPDWQVLFNLLSAMYHENSVKIDIAGTAQSISQISAELLYKCYNTFYNNSNMALAVCGNVKIDEVLSVADRILKKEEDISIVYPLSKEPEDIVKSYTETKMNVDIPKFAIGFKEDTPDGCVSAKDCVCCEILLDIIGGKVSPLYENMLSKGLINTSFYAEYFTGRGFSSPMFIGESKMPKEVQKEIWERIKFLRENGIEDEDFEISRKRLYGLELRSFNDVDDIGRGIIDSYFSNCNLFCRIEAYKTITKDDVTKILNKSFKKDKMCLSVIN